MVYLRSNQIEKEVQNDKKPYTLLDRGAEVEGADPLPDYYISAPFLFANCQAKPYQSMPCHWPRLLQYKNTKTKMVKVIACQKLFKIIRLLFSTCEVNLFITS